MITNEHVRNLPSSPGVYIFRKKNIVLYVGKSVNIKARVYSHIKNAGLILKEKAIITESDNVNYLITDSDFNAILLEAELIGTNQPKYNSVLKDDKSFLYIEVTKSEKYPKIILTRKPKHTSEVYFGPFSSVKTAETLIKEIRKIIPFCTQNKITKRGCFYSKIGLCSPCPNEIDSRFKNNNLRIAQESAKQYKKNIGMVIEIFKGKAKNILKQLYKELKEFIKNQDYEKAIPLRNKILRLETLMFYQTFHEGEIHNNYDNSATSIEQLIEVLKKYFPFLKSLKRIECYDISNLSQKQATASMVVFINGIMNKKEYKKFKIKDLRLNSDVNFVNEVLLRRFKNKWPYPKLLVIDGGKPQVSAVMKVLTKLHIKIPVIGIAKRPDRFIIGNKNKPTVYLDNNSLALNLIRRIRNESHRFAKKYHLLLRDKDFLV